MCTTTTGTATTTTLKDWNVDIHIVTWNVGSKSPDSTPLNNLLGLDKNAKNDIHSPDFYIIGLQEVNSQPQNVVIGLFKDDPWTQKFKELLKERDYVAVKSETMQGLLLILFAKRKHLLHLRQIETEFTRTGLGGLWGNKGAISIRLSLYGCAVTMVNAHLAAHDHELNERIVDYNQILDNHHYHVKGYREIFYHDYVFWFGDLNFRLNGESMTPQDIRRLIEGDRLAELIDKDQLTHVRKSMQAFHELEERIPAFPPTFKFEKGTCDYDMKRRPAWTDRILYRVKKDAYHNVELCAKQVSYKSHPGYDISDHKPVTSEFVIKVFDDPQEKTIEFAHIPMWYIGEENNIAYTIPADFGEENSDWIGVFRHDFTGLTEYLAYEYTKTDNNTPPLGQSGHYRERSIRLEFSESIDIPEDEYYILLYFQSTGIRGVSGLAGMSNVFRAQKRPPSPRFEAVD